MFDTLPSPPANLNYGSLMFDIRQWLTLHFLPSVIFRQCPMSDHALHPTFHTPWTLARSCAMFDNVRNSSSPLKYGSSMFVARQWSTLYFLPQLCFVKVQCTTMLYTLPPTHLELWLVRVRCSTMFETLPPSPELWFVNVRCSTLLYTSQLELILIFWIYYWTSSWIFTTCFWKSWKVLCCWSLFISVERLIGLNIIPKEFS